jgi:hypothetical protein
MALCEPIPSCTIGSCTDRSIITNILDLTAETDPAGGIVSKIVT